MARFFGPNTRRLRAFGLLVLSSGSACHSSDPAFTDAAAGESQGGGSPESSAGSSANSGQAALSGGSDGVGAAAGALAKGGEAGSGGADNRGGSSGTAHSEAGSGGTAVPGGSGGASGASESGVMGVIAVGYGGLRIVSRDLGLTWKNETHWSTSGGDDHDLLRTIAYGNGLWLSGGWRITTSRDGVAWMDRGDSVAVISAINCPVTDGLAFGAGHFLVACGSNLATSSNGLDWVRGVKTPNVGTHPYLLFDSAKNQFACSGDNGHSFVSSDGAMWTEVPIVTAHLCALGLTPKAECPSFYVQGVFLTTEWGGFIRRSTNGSSFTETYKDQFKNNLFTEYSFGVGRVAP